MCDLILVFGTVSLESQASQEENARQASEGLEVEYLLLALDFGEVLFLLAGLWAVPGCPAGGCLSRAATVKPFVGPGELLLFCGSQEDRGGGGVRVNKVSQHEQTSMSRSLVSTNIWPHEETVLVELINLILITILFREEAERWRSEGQRRNC